MTKQFGYKLPNICAKCGERKGSLPYPISSAQTTHYVVASKTKTFKFEVMVCDECMQLLKKLDKRANLIYAVTILIGIAAGITIVLVNGGGPQNIKDGLIPVSIIGAFLGLMVGLIVNQFAVEKKIDLGFYDGRLFHFTNDEFHRQFAALNPLITKIRKS